MAVHFCNKCKNSYFHYSAFSELIFTSNYLRGSPKVPAATANALHSWGLFHMHDSTHNHATTAPISISLIYLWLLWGLGGWVHPSWPPDSLEGCYGFVPFILNFIDNSCLSSTTSSSPNWLWGWEGSNSFFSLLSVSV